MPFPALSSLPLFVSLSLSLSLSLSFAISFSYSLSLTHSHTLLRCADPIPPLADALIAEAYVLAFDEFQVTDVADASILHRLFRALYERGLIVS